MSGKSGDLFVEQCCVEHREAIERGDASGGHTVGLIECDALGDVAESASDRCNHNGAEYGNCLSASDHQIRWPTCTTRCPEDVALTDCVDHLDSSPRFGGDGCFRGRSDPSNLRCLLRVEGVLGHDGFSDESTVPPLDPFIEGDSNCSASRCGIARLDGGIECDDEICR